MAGPSDDGAADEAARVPGPRPVGPDTDPAEPAAPATPAPSGPPTCYRHPDRETHIRCTRCNRSICPDCMISAAVGFQCPNCVREGSRDVRVPRTRLGGKVRANSDVVTKTLIGINVGMYLLSLLGGNGFVDRFKLIGRGFSAQVGGDLGVANGEWYRLLTATFMHQGVLHLGLNMFALWVFGTELERLLGRWRFLILYLMCGLAGSAASYAFSLPNQASVGASGAVFGLVGAALVIARRMRYDISVAASFLGLNLVIGFVYPGIDWRAHVGGLLAGLAFGAAFAYSTPRARTAVHAGTIAAIAAVVIFMVVWRTAVLT